MSIIAELLSSSVGVSIITGLITFAITWPVNNWLTKKTSKKEYYDRVEKVNQQIITVCADYVIMEKDVNDSVLKSIILGLCIEGKVKEEDTYSLENTKAVLVKEFVNMRLISDEAKKDIIKKLCISVDDNIISTNIRNIMTRYENNYRNSSRIDFLSMILSVSLGVIAVFVSMFMSIKDIELTETMVNNNYLWITFLMIIVGFEAFLILYIYFVKKIIKKRDEIREKNHSKKINGI